MELHDIPRNCVHGVIPILCWLGEDSLHRSQLVAPSVEKAYSTFMNGADKFDQYRSTNRTTRNVHRVNMRNFTFLMDAAAMNAWAVMRAITAQGNKVIALPQLRFNTISQLVFTYTKYKAARSAHRKLRPYPHPPSDGIAGPSSTQHVLLENISR